MHHRGITQTTVCKDLGLIVQNFNAFLKGSRGLAKDDMAAVLDYLGFAYNKDGTSFSTLLLETKITDILKGGNEKMANIAKSTGISPGTLSAIMNGKRQMSTKVIKTLAEYFGMKLVVLKKASSSTE